MDGSKHRAEEVTGRWITLQDSGAPREKGEKALDEGADFSYRCDRPHHQWKEPDIRKSSASPRPPLASMSSFSFGSYTMSEVLGSDYYPVERPTRDHCRIDMDFFCEDDDADAMSWEVRSDVLHSSTINPDSSSWMYSSWPLVSLSNVERPSRAGNPCSRTSGNLGSCSQDYVFGDSPNRCIPETPPSPENVQEDIMESTPPIIDDKLKHNRCSSTSTVIVEPDVMDSIDFPEVCLDQEDKSTVLIPQSLPWSSLVIEPPEASLIMERSSYHTSESGEQTSGSLFSRIRKYRAENRRKRQSRSTTSPSYGSGPLATDTPAQKPSSCKCMWKRWREKIWTCGLSMMSPAEEFSVKAESEAAAKRASAARARAWCHGRHLLLLNHIETAMDSDWSQTTHRTKVQSKHSTNTDSQGKPSSMVRSMEIDSVFETGSVWDRKVATIDNTGR